MKMYISDKHEVMAVKNIQGGAVNNYVLAKFLVSNKHSYVSTPKLSSTESLREGPDEFDLIAHKFGLDVAYNVVYTKGEAAFHLKSYVGEPKHCVVTELLHHIEVLKAVGFFKYISENADLKLSTGSIRKRGADERGVNDGFDAHRDSSYTKTWLRGEGLYELYKDFVDETNQLPRASVIGTSLDYLSKLCIHQVNDVEWNIAQYSDVNDAYIKPINFIDDDIANELVGVELTSILTNQRSLLKNLGERPEVIWGGEVLVEDGTF